MVDFQEGRRKTMVSSYWNGSLTSNMQFLIQSGAVFLEQAEFKRWTTAMKCKKKQNIKYFVIGDAFCVLHSVPFTLLNILIIGGLKNTSKGGG